MYGGDALGELRVWGAMLGEHYVWEAMLGDRVYYLVSFYLELKN